MGSLRLRVFKGEACVREQPLERGVVKIGRNATATIPLDDARASRVHAVLSVEADGRISIVHLGSAEGTFVNGKRIGKSYLKAGDEIRIGETRMVVEAAAKVAAPEIIEPAAPQLAVVPDPAPIPEPSVAPEVHAEAAPDPETTHGLGEATALRLEWSWGGTLLQTQVLERPRAYAPVESGLDLERSLEARPLIVPSESGGFALDVGPGMEAWLVTGEGDGEGETRRPLPEGRHPLQAPDRAEVTLAGLRVGLEFVRAAGRVHAPLSSAVDLRFGGMVVGLAAALILTLVFAHKPEAKAAAPSQTEIARAKVLFREAAEPPRPSPLLARVAEAKKKVEEGEAAERSREDEGQAGKHDAPPRKDTRSAPKAIDIDAKELVKASTLMRGLSAASTSTVFGEAGLGGDLKGALGGIVGTQVGDSGGFGGLGLKGAGVGGGGAGQTIGVGGIGTKGKGGGMGNYGEGVGGLAPRRGVDPTLAEDEVVVQGELDRELIRQVIRRNIGQVRFCYESQLQISPGLAGRVAMQFTIAPGGEVISARAGPGTTLADARVKDCIAVRMRGWRFPSPKGGGNVMVTYPFVFKPSGE